MVAGRVRARIRAPFTPQVPPDTTPPTSPPAPGVVIDGVEVLSLATPTGSVATKLIDVTNKANKWALNTWIPSTFPSTITLTNTETSVRTVSSVALGLAASIATGVHSSTVTGKTTAEAKTQAVRLIDALVNQHVGNGGVWGKAANVRPIPADASDQSALWAAQTALAAWMLWTDLTSAQRTKVLTMGQTEAARMVGWTIPYYKTRAGAVNYTGDSQVEQVSWDALPCLLMAAMQPGHANAASWIDTTVKMALAAISRPADLTSSAVVNGVTFGSFLNGTNVNDNGTVVNHAILHPEYIASQFALLWGFMGALTASGKAIPEALRVNAPVLYSAFTKVNFAAPPYLSPGGIMYKDDGTIYYPEGTDKSDFRAMDKVASDLCAVTYGWDVTSPVKSASEWASIHLTRQQTLQARSTTGETFLPGDEPSSFDPRNEQWIHFHCGTSLLTLAAGTPTWTNSSPAAIVTEWIPPPVSTLAVMKPAEPIFGASSFWTADVSTAPLHPDSAAIVANIAEQVAVRYNGYAALNYANFDVPLYEVDASTPTYRIGYFDFFKSNSAPPFFYNASRGGVALDVAIPDECFDANGVFVGAASGTDMAYCTWNRTTGELREFWKMQKPLAGGVDSLGQPCVAMAAFGGKMPDSRVSPGYFLRDPGGWETGTTATSISHVGGTIGILEMQAAIANGCTALPHAINLNTVEARRGEWYWPAQRTDGQVTGHIVRQGQRIRLRPDYTINPNAHPIARVIMETAKAHGFVIDDKAGAVALICEDGSPYRRRTGEPDPWDALRTLPGASEPTPGYSIMSWIPWGQFQALPADYGKPA